ncbi:PAS domain-containing protein [Pseudoalteromonas sp. Hal099]
MKANFYTTQIPDLRFGFEFNQAKTWSDEFSPTQNMNSHETLLIGDAPKQYFLNKRVSFEGDIAMLPLEMAVSIDSETLLERVAKRRESFIAITATFFTIFIIITLLYQRYINRKLLIHSLTEQNNKVIENSLDAIFTIDSDETIIHCNQTAKKFLRVG